MASGRFWRELEEELPEWVRDGVISEETAERLRARGAASAGASRRTAIRRMQLFLAALCAILTGGGAILLISHNWDWFSPALRLTAAYLALFAALGFGAFALLRRGEDARYCEPAALGIAAGTATAIAIVSQVYQVYGSTEAFLTVWLGVLLPMLYCFRSVGLTVVFSLGLGVLLSLSAHDNASLAAAMILLFASAWWFLRLIRGGSAGAAVVGEASAAWCGLLMTGILASGGGGEWVIFALFFPVLSLAGARLAGAPFRGWVFRLVGSGGILMMLSAASFGEFWRHMRPPSIGVAGAVWCVCLAGCWLALLRGPWTIRRTVCGAFPLLFCAGLLPEEYRPPTAAMLLCNLGLAALGIALLVSGFRRRRMGRMNGGLLVLSLLIFLRFCGAADDLLEYALVFLALGVMTGAVNWFFSRRMRKMEGEERE